MNGVSAKPEKEFKVGAVRATIWSNPRHTANGKAFNSHKILVERIYRDSQDNFKTTRLLDPNDVPKAILGLKKCYEYLTLKAPQGDAPTTKDYRSAAMAGRIP